MSRRLLPLILALPVFAIACGEDGDAGKDEDDDTSANDEDCWPYCDEISSSIAPTDDTALGVAGSAVTDPLPSSAESDIIWATDAEGALTWGVTVGTETLRYVEAEAVYPTCEGDVPAIGVDCPDYIAVEGSLSLVSSDGMLDASLPLTFSLDEYAVGEGAVSFSAAVEEADLGSGFSLADHVDIGAYDEVSMRLSGSISASGELNATLSAQGTADDGNVAWADLIDVAVMGDGAW
jgi:hypothetical protein